MEYVTPRAKRMQRHVMQSYQSGGLLVLGMPMVAYRATGLPVEGIVQRGATTPVLVLCLLFSIISIAEPGAEAGASRNAGQRYLGSKTILYTSMQKPNDICGRSARLSNRIFVRIRVSQCTNDAAWFCNSRADIEIKCKESRNRILRVGQGQIILVLLLSYTSI
jgi:hypothetical protein